MYKYYKLKLFLLLIGKFDLKSNFQPRLADLDLIRADLGPNERKTLFSKVVNDITLFLCTITTIKLVSSFNL